MRIRALHCGLLLLVALWVAGCGLPTGPETYSITVDVFALPPSVPGKGIDLTKPPPRVEGATITITGTRLKAVTDRNGQATLAVPVGVQAFVITPPPRSGLKQATYLESILAGGNDRLGFLLSPEQELQIDHATHPRADGVFPSLTGNAP